jgi:hypothetical protein
MTFSAVAISIKLSSQFMKNDGQCLDINYTLFIRFL